MNRTVVRLTLVAEVAYIVSMTGTNNRKEG